MLGSPRMRAGAGAARNVSLSAARGEQGRVAERTYSACTALSGLWLPACVGGAQAHAQYEALLAGRKREQTEQYKAEYAKRTGVEGTISQSVRTTQVRRTRYSGQAKTHLQHLMMSDFNLTTQPIRGVFA